MLIKGLWNLMIEITVFNNKCAIAILSFHKNKTDELDLKAIEKLNLEDLDELDII